MIGDPGPGGRSAGVPPGRFRAALVAIVVLAAALRLAALDKPFYVDEITTITVSSQPLGGMREAMREVDASPALYPLLLHVWLKAGRADAWVRLLPAMLGILAVPAAALVAARAFGPRAGLGAAFIMAIAPAQVHYAQYVRSYSLFTLLATVHVWLFMAWFEPHIRITPRRAAALLAVTTALLYTHYLSVLLFAGEGLVALLRLRDARDRALKWGAVAAVAGVLFLPGLPLLLHNAAFDRVRNAERPDPPPLHRLVPDLAGELLVGQRSLGFGDPATRRATLAAAAVLFPALWIAGAVRAYRTRPDMLLLLCAVSLLPIALYVASGRKLVAVRFFVPFAAGYLAVLGYGLASLQGARRWIAVAALVLVSAVPLWHFYSRFSWSYDHRRVARAIGERARPGDALLVVHPYEAFYYRWYLGTHLPIRGLLFTPLEEQDSYVIKPAGLQLAQARTRIADEAARHPRLWIVGATTRSFASDAREQAAVLAWMDATYRRVADLDALTGGDPTIRLYETGAGR